MVLVKLNLAEKPLLIIKPMGAPPLADYKKGYVNWGIENYVKLRQEML